MRTRAKLAAAVVAACLLVGGLTVANAAQLSVSAGSISTADAGPCSTGLTVTRTEPRYFLWFILLGYEGVRVSGDLEACRGREVVVRGTTGSPALTGTVPASGSTTLSWTGLTRYATNLTFVVTVDGWRIPSTTVNP